MSFRGITLTGMVAICATLWVVAFVWPIYVGAVALVILLAILAVFAFVSVRRFLQTRKEVSLRKARLSAVKSAIAEARCLKMRICLSKGLKQPNQSNTVRYINESISRLTFEQLQLEAELGRAAK